jgi:hypothetical protein
VFHAATHAISDFTHVISDTFVSYHQEETTNIDTKQTDKKETEKTQTDKTQTDKKQTDKRSIQSTSHAENKPKLLKQKKEETYQNTHTETKTQPNTDEKSHVENTPKTEPETTDTKVETEKKANTDKLPTDRNLPFNTSPKPRYTHKYLPEKAAKIPVTVLNPESPDPTDKKLDTPTKRYSDNNVGTAYGDESKQHTSSKHPNPDNNAGTAYGDEIKQIIPTKNRYSDDKAGTAYGAKSPTQSTPTINRYSGDTAGTAYGAETTTQKSRVPKSANGLATGSPDPKEKGYVAHPSHTIFFVSFGMSQRHAF